MNHEEQWDQSSEKTNDLLIVAYFPSSSNILFQDTLDHGQTITSGDLPNTDFITVEKVCWTINSFEPYKSPGLLQVTVPFN